MNRVAVFLILLFPLLLQAESPSSSLGRQIRETGLDPEECYQVRELNIVKEDLRIYLTEGYLIFGKAVDGRRYSAVFTADTESGDAEVLLMPPTRAERMSLASYAKTPNLNEHFRAGVMLFTDDTYAELMRQINRGSVRKHPERGLLLAQDWDSLARNMAASFQIRLVQDLLAGNSHRNGFFYSAVSSVRLGNFDLLYDLQAREQISLGQVGFRDDQTFFDIWTRFPARSFRTQARVQPPPDLAINSYRIEATLDPNLHLDVVTKAAVTPGTEARSVLSFDISSQMKVTKVLINGQEAEVFQPSALRAGLIRGDSNQTFLVLPAAPLEAGREYEVEFHHGGDVITDAGNHVYFVGARGSWYPHRQGRFARYDLTFRYPKELDLVATGKTVADSIDGPWHLTRHRTESPVRMAGFNLGNYERKQVTSGGYTIEVYSNKTLETALQRKRQAIMVPRANPLGRPGNQRWTVDLEPVPLDTVEIDPSTRLERVAHEIADGLDFMAQRFGPPILNWLTISPIPGTFGQGFPGLIYLSTLAYLDPNDRPASMRGQLNEFFYSDMLHAHETAHQWWGNVVTTASYEDDWIMEALANYSALLYLEKRKGKAAVDMVLDSYRMHLLSKTLGGDTVESSGPIIWGPRLFSSSAPNAWRIVTYEKGTWIIHMLRRRMGDDRFLEMLAGFRSRYQFQAVTTEQFRAVAAEGLPPQAADPQLDAFFDQWVYGTGIPMYKLTYKVAGKAPVVRVTGTIVQSDVDQDFSALVPVEIQVPKSKSVIQWVKTASDPVTFSVTVRQAPTKVTLDPGNSVLRRQ